MGKTLELHAVILAGGQGSRFWPVSRARKPKQFLSLGGEGESLIQAISRRVLPLVGRERVSVVTSDALRDIVLSHVPYAKVICEPMGKNTAASIGLAALSLANENPGAVMLVLPADQTLKNEEGMRESLKEAAELAASDKVLVSVGISPQRPHTGYGYLWKGAHIGGNAYCIRRFFEKPSLERAIKYCESGEYFWNSSMFAWQAEVILDGIKEFLPQLYAALMRIQEAKGTKEERKVMLEAFESMEPISIDFGVLEHARNSAMVVANNLEWSDVGSWDAWAEQFEADPQGNISKGDNLIIDCEGCVVYTEYDQSLKSMPKKLTALLGVKNIVVIDAGDALLICPRNKVQEVKKVVDTLKTQGRYELL